MTSKTGLASASIVTLGLATGLTFATAHAAPPPGPTCSIVFSTGAGDVVCSAEDGDEGKFFVNTGQTAGTSLVGSINKNNGPNDIRLTTDTSVEPPSQGYGEIKPSGTPPSWQSATFSPVSGSAFAFDGIFPNMQIGDATHYDGDLFAVVTDVRGNQTVFEWQNLPKNADLNRDVGIDEPAGTSGIAIASVDFLLAGSVPGANGSVTVDTGALFRSMKQIDVSICLAPACPGGGSQPPPPPVIPEPSTWAMMLLGFADLGYAGYRKSKSSRAFVA